MENESIIRNKYKQITEKLIKKHITITTMESCTSGFIASLLTDTEGASQIFKGAFITYSNEAKIECGVPKKIINQFGVYSKETAYAMAKACKEKYNTNIGIGITGSFSNVDPNNKDSVPGEVYVCIIKTDSMISLEKITGKFKVPIYFNRCEAKYYVAYLVANMLQDILK